MRRTGPGSNVLASVTNIGSNGNYLTVLADASGYPNWPTGAVTSVDLYEVFDNGTIVVVPGAGVTAGTVSVGQYRMSSGTFDFGAPVVATLTAGTNNIINLVSAGILPAAGLRVSVAGLTGGNITTMQLILTKR